MTTADWKLIRRMIRRRIRLSKHEAFDSLRRKDNYLVNYHNGCIGMGLCLIEDIDKEMKKK